MISSRYSLPVALLLVLAIIPTVIHNYLELSTNDGKSVEKIATTLNGFTSVPAKRNPQWGKDIFASSDWIERIYHDRRGGKVRLFAARSYDHKRLYHHPELALSYGHNLMKEGEFRLSGHPEIPFYVLRSRNNNDSDRVAYVLLYDNEFITDPISHQIGDSLSLLVNARKPMTLFYISQTNINGETEFAKSAAASLLAAAIQSFRSQQSGDNRSKQ